MDNLKIKEARERLRMSQAQLGVKAGVHYNTIKNIEKGGNYSPKIDVLERICAALDMSVSDVLEVRGG